MLLEKGVGILLFIVFLSVYLFFFNWLEVVLSLLAKFWISGRFAATENMI